MVIDSSLAGDTRVAMAAAAAVPLLADRYALSSSPAGMTWPDLGTVDACSPERVPVMAGGVEAGIAEGRRLFFVEMDGDSAAAALDKAVSGYFDAPCLAVYNPGLQTAACRAGVLLVRLRLLSGMTEAAADTAAFIASRCSVADTDAEDVPPEARRFVEGARPVQDVGRTFEPLVLRCAGSCRGVLVDGRAALCSDDECSEAAVAAGRGRHFVAFPQADGRVWYSGWFSRETASAVLMVAPGVRPGTSGVLTAGGVDRALASRLSAMTGCTVLAIVPVPGGEGWRLIAAGSGEPEVPSLASLTPEGGAVRFTAVPGIGLELEPGSAWPWPWVSGSLAAGFLTAGIVLNVYSERALSDAEAGRNTMARYEGLKAGAIAGYVTAGAGVLATVLLAVLRPEPDQSVLISPSPAGFSVSF